MSKISISFQHCELSNFGLARLCTADSSKATRISLISLTRDHLGLSQLHEFFFRNFPKREIQVKKKEQKKKKGQ